MLNVPILAFLDIKRNTVMQEIFTTYYNTKHVFESQKTNKDPTPNAIYNSITKTYKIYGIPLYSQKLIEETQD